MTNKGGFKHECKDIETYSFLDIFARVFILISVASRSWVLSYLFQLIILIMVHMKT